MVPEHAKRHWPAAEAKQARSGRSSGSQRPQPGSGHGRHTERRDTLDARQLLDQSNDAFFVENPDDARILDVNARACELTGLSREQLLDLRVMDINPTVPDIAAWHDRVAAVRKHGGRLVVGGQLRSADGEPLPTELSLRYLEVDGAPRVVAIVRDVSERKRTEYELRVMADRLNEAQRVASIGSWELDLQTDRLWWSDETYRMFGQDPQAFPASYEAFLERIHPLDRQTVDRAYQASVTDHTHYSIDHRFLAQDGTTRWVHEQGETTYDEDGTPLRSVGTTQDITERKELEIEREALKQRYQELLENAADAIVLVDPEHGIQFANRRVQTCFGYAPEELMGQPVEVLIPDRHGKKHVQHRDRYMRHATARPMGAQHDLTARRKDGSEFPVDVSLNPVAMGEGQMIMATVRDITDRRAAENAEKSRMELEHARQVEAALRDFINAAAHDLKQPITPMKIGLHNLRHVVGELNAEQAKAFDIVQRNVERMHLLVEDLLDVARLESGTLRYDLAPTSLAGVADETCEFFGPAAKDAGIELVADCPEVEVQADRRRIMQVLFNLVGNALKFTPTGGQVTVHSEAAGEHVRIAVTDTGAGLQDEQMARLFEPFTQVHEPRPGLPPGTGLGLYISRGIIEGHGGQIGVESPGSGQGATFWFTLPTAR